MLCNYLATAYRNLKRHKAFSAINILGLAIGMAACLLILQYVTFQFSFDAFHENKDHIYRVVLGETVPGRQVTPPALGPVIKREYPGVKRVARLLQGIGVVNYENTVFTEDKLYFADASFLQIFSYPLVKGNPAEALTQPNTAVISQSMARKHFGEGEAVGKTLRFSNTQDGTSNLLITGVLQDIPPYSHLQFNMLISYATLKGEQFETEFWNWRNFTTYVLLDEHADSREIEASLPQIVKRVTQNNQEYASFWLQPLTDIHVSGIIKEEGSTSIEMIYFLLMLALFILVIAWINYINLSTARAIERAKEVGVRKAVGASRFELFKQFLLESTMLNAAGMMIAFTIVQLSLPYFRELTGLQLSLSLWKGWHFWAALMGLFIVGTLLSGIYPALVLSSFKPIVVLKGRVQNNSGSISLRKSLVVFQFAASVILMTGTFAVYLQMSHMRNQSLGMNIDQTLVIKGPQLVEDSASMASQWNVFKTKMKNIAAVKQLTASDVVPSKGYNSYYGNVRVEGVTGEEEAKANMFATVRADADFLPALSIPIVAGRGFSKDLATDKQNALINEEALSRLGFTNPEQALGKPLQLGDRRLTIIGVVRNYHHNYLKNGYYPTVFRLDPGCNEYFSLKLNTGTNPATTIKQTIAGAENVWKQIYPGNPFEYFFLDDAFNEQYKADQQLGSTIALFAFLAILVACMGLFGLASFTTTQRTKEIGIRKVLGASVSDIVRLLNVNFLSLILLSNLIAWPLAYWGINKWLEAYKFAIQINLWLFIAPALLVLLIALVTISFQTIKAARANPVKALRSE
jgi:putative ABC transport system permease protein